MARPSLPAFLLVFLLARGVAAQQYDLRVFGVEDGLPGSTVTAIAQDSTGFLWIDTDGGLCRFDGRTFTDRTRGTATPPAELHAVHGNDGYHLPATSVVMARPGATCSARTPDGTLWCGTAQGLQAYRGSDPERPLRTLTHRNGLGGDAVRCLFVDRSGSLWIGATQGGLTHFTSDAAVRWDAAGGLPGDAVTAIARGPGGALVLGCAQGGLFVQWNDSVRAVYGPADGLERTDIRNAAFTTDGRLLVGTGDGLFTAPFKQPLRFTRVPRSRQVNALLPLPNGHAWVAARRGVFDVAPDGKGVRVGRDSTEATALLVMGDSVLIGTPHGLRTAPVDNSAADQRPLFAAGDEAVTALVRDRAGNTWIGTADRGLLRWSARGVRRWSTADGLASDRVRQVLLDAYDNVWVGSDRGFDLLELDELQEEVIDITHHGLADGFPGIDALPDACFLDADSAVWFGTTRGAVRFDPRRVLSDPLAPRTRLTDLQLFFEHPDWRPWCDSLGADGLPRGLVLAHDRDHLTFRFSGLSLAYPDQVRFQTKLEGLDADWSPITAQDRITYNALAPGSYTFLVKARNGSGVWNDRPARFPFTIAPPVWRTTPFLVGSAVVLALLAFGALRLRDARARRERERLKRMVRERTRELEEEKHRSDSLLLNILPEMTAAELKERGTAEARHYDECTVLFSDFQGFTPMSEHMEATGIVTELDRFFRAFDRLTDVYGLEKIKTIGDAYMCASGVPLPKPDHAMDAVRMGLDMLREVERINAERAAEGKAPWPIRIGLHSGPLVAGVVGEKKFAYDIWGTTVNLASRMESSGAAGRLNCSATTYALVRDRVQATPRGPITVKGKGEVEMYFVDALARTADPGRAGPVPGP